MTSRANARFVLMPRTAQTLIAASLAALIFAPTALAGKSTTLASPDDAQIEGAYAYRTHIKTSTAGGTKNLPYVVVVVRTAGEMPRRFDGLIRASVTVDQAQGARSTSSVGDKSSACYETAYRIVNNRFYKKPGAKRQKMAGYGKPVVARITTEDEFGQKVTDTFETKIRKQRAGDASGKPLDC